MNTPWRETWLSSYCLGGCVLFVLGVLNLWAIVSTSSSSDFFLVWALGKAGTLQQTEFGNLYTKESKHNFQKSISEWPAGKTDPKLQDCLRQRADMNLCATPFYFSAHFPFLSFTSYEREQYRYSWVLVFCFCLAIVLAAFLFEVSKQNTLFFLALCFLFFDPFFISLSLGNSNEITLLGCVIFHFFQKRSPTHFGVFWEGIWITLLTLFKPLFIFSWFLILISKIVFEGWNKVVEFLGGALGALFLALGISAFYFNLQDSWWGWHTYLRSLDLAYWADSIRFGNQALIAGVYSVSGKDLTFFSGFVLFVLVCILLSVWKNRFPSGALPFALRVWLFWLGFFCFQSLSPLVWYHYESHLALLFFLLFASFQSKNIRGNGWRFGIFLLSWMLIASRSSWESYFEISRAEATFQIYIAEVFLFGVLSILPPFSFFKPRLRNRE